MNFKDRLTALELEMVCARNAGDTEKLRNLEAQHDEVTNAAWEYVYERACERARLTKLTGLRGGA